MRNTAHPVKILPFPSSQEKSVPTISDVVVDLLAVRGDEPYDTVSLSTGDFAPTQVPGPEMMTRLFQYTELGTVEAYNSVVYPLSMKVRPKVGVGKVNVNALVPLSFRDPNHWFMPGPEGWSTSLVPRACLATMHLDHPMCGVLIAHFFGKKVRFFSFRLRELEI